MKKLLFILVLAAFALMSYGQAGASNTVTVDTLQGSETVNFDLSTTFAGENELTVQALCTQLGGTSDGTLALQGSVDGTSYSFINFVAADLGTSSPVASHTGADLNQITITDGLVASWVLHKTPYRKYRIVGVGTSSDTTKVTIFYTYK